MSNLYQLVNLQPKFIPKNSLPLQFVQSTSINYGAPPLQIESPIPLGLSLAIPIATHVEELNAPLVPTNSRKKVNEIVENVTVD